MAYQVLQFQYGYCEVRCMPGAKVHVQFRVADNTWSVDEDAEHRRYQSEDEAIDRAREIGHDPDWRLH